MPQYEKFNYIHLIVLTTIIQTIALVELCVKQLSDTYQHDYQIYHFTDNRELSSSQLLNDNQKPSAIGAASRWFPYEDFGVLVGTSMLIVINLAANLTYITNDYHHIN